MTASEGAKSNALMRCCKDLGVASVLWDPIFIAQWKSKYAVEKLYAFTFVFYVFFLLLVLNFCAMIAF